MTKKFNFSQSVKNLLRFFTQDIWRITGTEISKTRRFFYNSIKTLIVAVRGFTEDNLQVKASALVYYTLFAIVPVLALIFAIGRGFGFQDLIVNAISKQFSVQSGVLPYILDFVENYLERVQGGLFVGVGIAVLLWSVMSGFRQIELIFNDIWQVKKGRSLVVQFSTYFSLMLIVPIFIVASSGLSIFVATKLGAVSGAGLLSPLLNSLIKFSPFFINWLLFTGIFIVVPNTRVRFMPAFMAGVFTGTFFQLFQILYIKGQVYLSSYNAVYGSFAIIPLLLLWLQTSWLIILLGAELAYAAQNISNFEYEADAQSISRRYKDFLVLLIMKLIVDRFAKGQEPLSSEEISKENEIPIRLVTSILNKLVELDLISEILNEKTKDKAYQPALDINKISVSYLFDKIEQEGSEVFKVDTQNKYAPIWSKLADMKELVRVSEGQTLIKDL